MKQKFKSLTLTLPLAFLLACNSEPKGFELKGKLDNSHGEMVFLELMSTDGIKTVDSVTLDDKGEFVMTPYMSDIGFYRLKISPKNFATFIFDTNQQVTVTGNAEDLGNTYTVEGSPDSKLFWEINQVSIKNYRQRDSLQKTFQAYVNMVKMDSVRMDSMSNALEKPYNELINQHNNYLKDFVEKHPESFASLVAIQQLPAEQFMDTYIKLDGTLLAKYPNSAYAKSFHAGLTSQNNITIGKLAPEITMNTPDEKPLSLSSLRGKIVLIDFWASWCAPCRAENPNVVKAYNTYKSKGFDVYSVSLDKDMDKWERAIEKDNLSWSSHVCDFKDWNSPVVQLYNFNSIPSNVLIDKDGKVIAKDLRGEDLENKLAELFQ